MKGRTYNYSNFIDFIQEVRIFCNNCIVSYRATFRNRVSFKITRRKRKERKIILCNLEQDFIILYYRSGFIKLDFYLEPINWRIYISSEYSKYNPKHPFLNAYTSILKVNGVWESRIDTRIRNKNSPVLKRRQGNY